MTLKSSHARSPEGPLEGDDKVGRTSSFITTAEKREMKVERKTNRRK